MKRNLQIGLFLSALIPTLGAGAQAIPMMPDEVTLQEIPKPLDTGSADNYLIDMARTAGINVFADATDFPADSTVIPYPATSAYDVGTNGNRPPNWNSNLRSLIGDFTAQEKLTVLRSAPRTFLFWSEPDPRQLLALQSKLTIANQKVRWAQAVAEAKAAGTPDDEIIREELSDDPLRKVLKDYLQSIGWKGTVAERTNPVDIRVPFSDLPPDLRALVLLDLQKRLVRNWPDAIIQDLDWKTKRMSLSSEADPHLEIRHQIPSKSDDGYTTVLYQLTTLDDALNAPTDAPIASMQEPKVTPVQLSSKDTMSNAYTGISDETTVAALEADQALQKPISLEVKRLTLREVLKQAQEQGGVRFTLGEDAPADKLITARVEKMPLSQWMGVLARVYGVTWDKTGEAAYQMNGNERGELHLKLLQLGDPRRYRDRFSFSGPSERTAENAAIGKAIVDQFGVEALKKPEGVAFSALSQPLQRRLIYALEDRGAEFTAVSLFRANRMMVEQLEKQSLILRFGTPVTRSYHTAYTRIVSNEPQDWLRFNVQSADGEIVLPVFDEFYQQAAKPGETDPRPPSRRR